MIYSDFFPAQKTAKFGIIISDPKSVFNAIDVVISKYKMKFKFQEIDRLGSSIFIPHWMSDNIYNLENCRISVCEADGGCFYFCNLADSWNSLFYGVISDLKCDAVFLRSSPDLASKADFIQSFDVYNSGEIIRSAQIYFDQKWEFQSVGEPLDMERSFPYHVREKRKRLDRSSIIHVFKKFAPSEKSTGSFKIREWNRSGDMVSGSAR